MNTWEKEIFAIRHGETEWSLSGRHTGRTDVPLTDDGMVAARGLGQALASTEFARVLSSPLQRARVTCQLAGLGERMEIDPDLTEWHYGEYEGLTPEQIDARAPGWLVFSDGCPGGESPEQVATRVDRLIARVRGSAGHVALFGHGHLLRAFAARWLGLTLAQARHFVLHTSTLSILGYYRDIPALKRWNAPVAEGRLIP